MIDTNRNTEYFEFRRVHRIASETSRGAGALIYIYIIQDSMEHEFSF